ncbi:hypothetical protein [Rhizobium sp. BK176]|uniref:hypothetical protein n=1 Tax=Rhizobium sp. BK176 TaxID=2587071 RepID=UPI00216A279C|nr:hypothetical protein [Rhizobium sp. BK176]MCS4088676.1 hypothetical protein [Rhizobium sp. BK176]
MDALNSPSDGQTNASAEATRTGPQGASPPPVARKPDFGSVPPRPANQAPAMGAVLRREPKPPIGSPAWLARPASWDIAPLSSSVDNAERRRPWDGDAGSHPSARSVDNAERAGPSNPRGYREAEGFDDDNDPISLFPSVDNLDGFDAPPVGQYIEPARFTRLKGPQTYRPQGRSGPDKEVQRLLREAKKQQVVDRARARGRDPNEGAEEVVKGVTRSVKTQQQYVDRGNQLLARYRRERGIIQDDLLSLDTVEFADWVLSLKPTLKATTWRPYKQSAKAVLATLPEADQAMAILDADTSESGSEPERKPTKEKKKGGREMIRRTSALKAKSISKPDFDRIVNYLRFLSSSKYGHTLADWLVAGIATGLRPGEWMATSLEISEDPDAPKGRYVWLYVLNAKSTNGRGNGQARTVDLSNVRDETVEAIKRMCDRGREWLVRGTYGDMQGQCAQLLYNTAERMFPGRKLSIALYTTRHQFLANAKSYHPPEAVSAMAGHGVDNTAMENYGKKRSAWNMDDIEDKANPLPEEVATVKRRHTFYEDRVKMQEAAGIKPRGMGMGGDD